jgi:hypothetical protein
MIILCDPNERCADDALEKSYRPCDRKNSEPWRRRIKWTTSPLNTERNDSKSQSVSKLNKDTYSMVVKQILCKTRFCVALLLTNCPWVYKNSKSLKKLDNRMIVNIGSIFERRTASAGSECEMNSRYRSVDILLILSH